MWGLKGRAVVAHSMPQFSLHRVIWASSSSALSSHIIGTHYDHRQVHRATTAKQSRSLLAASANCAFGC